MSKMLLTGKASEPNQLNFHKLVNGQWFDRHLYERVRGLNYGSLFEVYGNDVDGKFSKAIATLDLTQEQTEVLHEFHISFNRLERVIDPNRLVFKIEQSEDLEVCIFREATSGGIVNLMIVDCSFISLSFVSGDEKALPSQLMFFEEDNIDYESISYSFFSF